MKNNLVSLSLFVLIGSTAHATTQWTDFNPSAPWLANTLNSLFSNASITPQVNNSTISVASGGNPGSYLFYQGLGLQTLVEFTATFTVAQSVLFSSVAAEIDRPAFTSGTKNINLYYSIDGGAFNLIAGAFTQTGGGVWTSTQSINLSAIPNLFAGQTLAIEFRNVGGGALGGDAYPVNWDNITFTAGAGAAPTPEPSTFALAGAAGLTFLLARLRRRR